MPHLLLTRSPPQHGPALPHWTATQPRCAGVLHQAVCVRRGKGPTPVNRCLHVLQTAPSCPPGRPSVEDGPHAAPLSLRSRTKCGLIHSPPCPMRAKRQSRRLRCPRQRAVPAAHLSRPHRSSLAPTAGAPRLVPQGDARRSSRPSDEMPRWPHAVWQLARRPRAEHEQPEKPQRSARRQQPQPPPGNYAVPRQFPQLSQREPLCDRRGRPSTEGSVSTLPRWPIVQSRTSQPPRFSRRDTADWLVPQASPSCFWDTRCVIRASFTTLP